MFILKNLFKSLIFLLSIMNILCASVQTSKDKMKADLENIKNIFEVTYAPAEWKRSYYDWDLITEIEKAKDKVQAADKITCRQFQGIVRGFFNSTKDYHVKVNFYSTESSELPFSVKPFNGKYYISSVLNSKEESNRNGISVGDELIEFDHRPINDVIQELKIFTTSNSNPMTDEEMAAMYLTRRSGRLGHITPKGSLRVKIRSASDDKVKTLEMTWKYTPEKVSNGFEGCLSASSKHDPEFLSPQRFFDRLMVLPDYSSIKTFYTNADNLDKQQDYIGSKNSLLPPLGTIWRKTPRTSPFQAYIYENHDGKLIGFIRIADFELSDDALIEFATIIDLFEVATEVLVIDQMNNPGGYLESMYELLSMLTTKPLKVPKHREMITQQEAFEALEMIELLEQFVASGEGELMINTEDPSFQISSQTHQRLLGYFKFIESQWEAGIRLTDLSNINGMDQIHPNSIVCYTKPILVLINSLDFSCADFFPAILQDNNKAILMGSRTAGAGGCVREIAFPNRHGINSFSITTSIAERLDGTPIENLGVIPDIEYNFSKDDILFEYRDFANQINKQVSKILQLKDKHSKKN